mmetsp:Transcript_24342/g.34057  ORF Transcript_24342/g.34057 Transcript_24342/m.34057 type:complete len:95 (+) Transcript_24342:3-287(+)
MYQSTKHRVFNPTTYGPDTGRMSIAYFQKPDPDLPIYPIGDEETENFVLARSLTRVGILDYLINEKGMNNEQARHEYHRLMESPYLLEERDKEI